MSAKREAFEEAGIDFISNYTALNTVCSVPINCFKDSNAIGEEDCLIISEFCLEVELKCFKKTE